MKKTSLLYCIGVPLFCLLAGVLLFNTGSERAYAAGETATPTVEPKRIYIAPDDHDDYMWTADQTTYEQAWVVDGMVYTSGQIALEPKTGEMVAGGVVEQTRRVLENLKAVLEAAGSSLDRVVRTTVYLTDLSQFATLNTIYAEYFGSSKPARSTAKPPRKSSSGYELPSLNLLAAPKAQVWAERATFISRPVTSA